MKLCAFIYLISRPRILNLMYRNLICGKFLENYISSEGAVSHNVLYHQPLPITRYQERFYANNSFEYLPKVCTGFKSIPTVAILTT